MGRKITIYILSVFIMILGLLRISVFFYPFFDSTKPRYLDLFSLVAGLFIFIVGWNLFRLNEFGRELTFWLLFLTLIGNFLGLGFSLPRDSDFTLHMNYLGRPIFDSKNDWTAMVIFLSVLLLLNVSTLIFLEQRETKKMFMPKVADNTEAKTND